MQDIRHHIKLIESMNNSDSTPEWIELVTPSENGPVAYFDHLNYKVKLHNGNTLLVVRVEFDVATGIIRVYFSTGDTGIIASDNKLKGLDAALIPLFTELFAPFDIGDVRRSTVTDFIRYTGNEVYVTYGSYYLSGQAEAAWFDYLGKMDYETKLKAIKSDPDYIRYIDDPDETLQMTAVNRDPYSIQHIVNPTESVQWAVIKDNPATITYIENPTILNNPEVKPYIIKYMLERMKINAVYHVTRILDHLRKHSANWPELSAFERSLAAQPIEK